MWRWKSKADLDTALKLASDNGERKSARLLQVNDILRDIDIVMSMQTSCLALRQLLTQTT